MQRYDQYPWYHGKLDRHRGEDILRNKRTGTYLVRDSSSIPGDYVLSVRENASLGALYSHYIINHRAGLYIIGDQTFSSLPEVIEFYHDHYLDTTVLTEIAERDQAPCGPTATVQPRGQQGNQLPPPVQVAMPVPDGGPAATRGMPSDGRMMGGVPGAATTHNGTGLCTVRAMFKFQSDDPEDLQFEKDDIMVILTKDEDAWWTARHQATGKEGSIPVPYVEVINEPKREEPRAHAPAQAPAAVRHDPRPASLAASASSPPPVAAAAAASGGGAKGPVKALAILDRYASAYDKTALSFKAGETITVLRQNENGLWEGELNGRQGHFPFTHVQVIDDGSDPASYNY